MKSGIYTALAAINQATKEFTENLEKLRDAKIITPHYAELRILAARMNCAEVTGSIVNHLVKPEMERAYRLEQEFAKKTAKLASSKGGLKKKTRLKSS